MNKKNLIPDNPVLSVLGLEDDAIVISPAPERRRAEMPRPVERRQAPKREKEELKGYLQELDVPRPPKPETKSKRLNLLVKPSVLKEATKIAAKYGISVNELINRLLEGVVKNQK